MEGESWCFPLSLFSKQHSTKLEDEFFALVLACLRRAEDGRRRRQRRRPPPPPLRMLRLCFSPSCLSLPGRPATRSFSLWAQTLSFLPIANTQRVWAPPTLRHQYPAHTRGAQEQSASQPAFNQDASRREKRWPSSSGEEIKICTAPPHKDCLLMASDAMRESFYLQLLAPPRGADGYNRGESPPRQFCPTTNKPCRPAGRQNFAKI